MTAQDQDLTADFPKADEDRWRRSVERALKGSAFDRLITKTYDGGVISPLYQRAEAPGPRALRRAPGRWTVLARVDIADDEAANRQALEELNGGADGLQLVFSGSQGAYGAALSGSSEAALEHILRDVRLDWGMPLALDDSPFAAGAADAIARFLDKRHIDPSVTRVAFGFDPLGAKARHGFLPGDWRETSKDFAAYVKRATLAGFTHGTVAADARVIHAAGGAEAQELGFVLASALSYLRALTDGGLDLAAARSAIMFRLAVDADEFASVAKLRALRRLWARIEESCGLAPAPALIHAETAWRMMTKNDPWNNILRATVAVFAAAVGGADAISVVPFTQPIGTPDAFARRLARDTQLVLQDESYLYVVDDPAAGSGGFESLTQDLCARGWAAFQAIEAQGGLAKALETGDFHSEVAQIAKKRAAHVAHAKECVAGANQFPNISEAPLTVIAPFAELSPRIEARMDAHVSCAFAPIRLAEPFEQLRDASDAYFAKNGARPRIFLATLGPVAAFTARANFAKNFFEAGGIEAVFGPQSEDTAEIAKEFRASGAKLACLCSSDRLYADAAEPVAIALRGAGAKLYLAGRPGELEAPLREAGVNDFIYAGCDMLSALRQALGEAT